MLEIKNKENLVCWQEDSANMTQKTEIKKDADVDVVIVYEGSAIRMSANKGVFNTIVTPVLANNKLNKGKMLFDKKAECEIFASNKRVFSILWGTEVLNVVDKETNIPCTVRANGACEIQIQFIQDVVKSFNVHSGNPLTVDTMWAFFRTNVFGVLSSVIGSHLNSANVSMYSLNTMALAHTIKDACTQQLSNKGIEVTGIAINHIDYDESDKAKIESLNKNKLDVAAKKIDNQAVNDTLDIMSKHKDVLVDNRPSTAPSYTPTPDPAPRVAVCKRCQEVNSATSVYCCKCGEKL